MTESDSQGTFRPTTFTQRGGGRHQKGVDHTPIGLDHHPTSCQHSQSAPRGQSPSVETRNRNSPTTIMRARGGVVDGHSSLIDHPTGRPLPHPQPIVGLTRSSVGLPFHSFPIPPGTERWRLMTSGFTSPPFSTFAPHFEHSAPSLKLNHLPGDLITWDPLMSRSPLDIVSSTSFPFPCHFSWLNQHHLGPSSFPIGAGRPPQTTTTTTTTPCDCTNRHQDGGLYGLGPLPLGFGSPAGLPGLLSPRSDGGSLPSPASQPLTPSAAATGSPSLGQEVIQNAELKKLEQFAASFKARRIKLGYTQTNVGEFISSSSSPSSSVCFFFFSSAPSFCSFSFFSLLFVPTLLRLIPMSFLRVSFFFNSSSKNPINQSLIYSTVRSPAVSKTDLF